MDRLIYTAMTGTKQIMEQQTTVSHNMANVGSTGFRAQIDAFRAVPVEGKGLATRSQVSDDTVGADFSEGTIRQTGRSLDVAIKGAGWITVQGSDGKEAYTRAGALKITPNGILQSEGGLNVQGDSGPISIPFDTSLLVGKDGTISSLIPGSNPESMAVLGRIKLVNPQPDTLKRGDDGLFRSSTGKPVAADIGVSLLGGALEDSNVNIVESMVDMISLGRQFDMNMSLFKNAQENDTKASQILNLSQ
ncbi:flagellar basal-body rod protein FlgF [Methylobacter sp. S3L5C]|uniref:flagellar basal-body rod protein FlgF n=1 Tax=Methylobacter sp. S3L5C TaxID=2839024 RepID=UPI001FADD395|nr:flagellar basal-body rod protein FlgF [Methylobacter sp. S3L5C]UOA08759.1 flagellar basal-body rod protein FlgF [Methylobacter sp. S3L5C]